MLVEKCGCPPRKMWGEFKILRLILRITRITLGPMGIISPNLSTWCAARQGWKLGYIFLGACTLKISGRPTWRNFWTTLDFDRKYLRNESGYRQADNGVINYNPSHVWQKNRINFGPLTKEFIRLILTHPRSILSETIFRPLGGAAPSNFYMW